MSFREFAIARDPALADLGPKLTMADLTGMHDDAALRMMHLHHSRFELLLLEYLATGGFPVALWERLDPAGVKTDFRRDMWNVDGRTTKCRGHLTPTTTLGELTYAPSVCRLGCVVEVPDGESTSPPGREAIQIPEEDILEDRRIDLIAREAGR